MKKCIILIYLMVFNWIVFCQTPDNNCNRAVRYKALSKKLPKNICIEKGLEFSLIYSPTDINNDGYLDLIVQVRHANIKDGDTLRLLVYFQDKNGNYANQIELKNLFPIYFNNYSLNYSIKDSKLDNIQGSYGGAYPLKSIDFNKDQLIIHLMPSMTDHCYLYYRFDALLSDWFLEKTIYKEQDVAGKEHEIRREDSGNSKISIKKFTYSDFL